MAGTLQAPETKNEPLLSCIGCGKDTTNLPADRRSLQSAASEHIVQTWKALLQHVVSQGELDIDSLVSTGKMCRKCFSAYDRYETFQISLLSNLREAIHVAVPVSSPKRVKLDSSATRRTTTSVFQLQRPTCSTSTSPDVAVSNYWQLTMHVSNLKFLHRYILVTKNPKRMS